MRTTKRLAAFILIVSIALLSLSGCGRKKFDSPDAMISEMTGTYSGPIVIKGERIVIDQNHMIQFNIDDIFPQITDEDFFWGNFPNEDWNTFDLNALLDKSYVKITTKPISANIKKSTISGLRIKKDGTILSQDDYQFTKISSEAIYPTAEMQEKFEEYRNYLQEYEINIILDEANSDFAQKEEAMEAVLSSAKSSGSVSKKAQLLPKRLRSAHLNRLRII